MDKLVIYKFKTCKELFRFAKEVIAIGIDPSHVYLRQENHYLNGEIDKTWYELETVLDSLQEVYLNEVYQEFHKDEES